jgi:NifU-like protein involved in Fe-S cluster formation
VLPPEVLAMAPKVLRGEAGIAAQGAWVVFHIAATNDNRVIDARFQAYGCPHTLATAAWLAEQLPGRTLGDLFPSRPADWAVHLQIPTEKLGRLLLIEDALLALA